MPCKKGAGGKFSLAASARWEGQHFTLLNRFQRAISLLTDARSKTLAQHGQAEDFRAQRWQSEPAQILLFPASSTAVLFRARGAHSAKSQPNSRHNIESSASACHRLKYTEKSYPCSSLRAFGLQKSYSGPLTPCTAESNGCSHRRYSLR